MQINNLNKYGTNSSGDKSTKELMILVIQKAKNHLFAAQQFAGEKEKDYVEIGRNILIVVQILETLAKVSSLNQEDPNMAQVQRVYEILAFQVENLVANKAKPDEYEYFIHYFEQLKGNWQDYADISRESADVKFDFEKKIIETEEDISSFYKDGKFEVVT